MSLRKSPILTPARLAANRRNALKSTGPRTAAGKAWSRLNGLRSGLRSLAYQEFLRALVEAEPCGIERVARTALTPEQASRNGGTGCPDRCSWSGWKHSLDEYRRSVTSVAYLE